MALELTWVLQKFKYQLIVKNIFFEVKFCGPKFTIGKKVLFWLEIDFIKKRIVRLKNAVFGLKLILSKKSNF